MDIQITQSEATGAERHIHVAVPPEAVQAAEEKTTRRYASQARLPGFRPGKAPAAMVKKRYADAIRQDVLQEIVQEAYKTALEREQLEVIAQPHIHDLKFEPGEPVTFVLHLEVRPEVKLERVEGFSVERSPVEVSDDMVDQQLDQMRDQRATWNPVEDNPMPGDMVTVELAMAEEDGSVPAGQEFRLTLGTGQAIEPIEELIMEAKPGQTVERPVKWPEDFEAEAQRGQVRTVRVQLKDVKRKTSPVLDDALARELGDFDSVDALRATVRKDLEASQTRDGEAEVRSKLLDQIIEANPFDVPPTWVQQLVQSYGNAYQIPEQDLQRFGAEFRPLAERQVRRDLIVDAIARQENLRATEADVDDRVSELAKQRNVDAGQVYAALQKSGRLSEIEHGITEERVFAWLLERNTVA
jgi:trigger factor